MNVAGAAPASRNEEMVDEGIPGERRVVTMLFCDVQGSTAAAGRLDPEEWSQIINGAFEHMIRPIDRYEGTVARLMGDGILAFFGAPTAHEDDPQRAVLAGLDIITGMGQYAERVKADWDMDIHVRVGINTGLVVVGTVGADRHVEYTALGDAINLAARMEQTAEPGTVQIAEPTYRLVAQRFEIETLDRITVKGKEEPVPVYRVLGRRPQAIDADRLEGAVAPLINRKAEMAALRQAAGQLRSGRGGIVLLMGDAGIGKSRILRELRTELSEELDGTLRWITGHGVSFDSAQPYGVFQEMLRQISGVLETDSPETVRQKILTQGKLFPYPDKLSREVSEAAEFLLAIAVGANLVELEGEALKRQLYESMLLVWRESAGQTPLLAVFDDLQWSDPASVELLVHLFRLVNDAPLLFICALRPMRRLPGWRIKQSAEADYPHRYTELNLGPLTEPESSQLVGGLLSATELQEDLFADILQKTGGNPLFVEAVIQDLVDHGTLSRVGDNGRWRLSSETSELSIPDNLQSLLAARLDRLERGTRQTLELASVIGVSFYARILKHLSDDPDAVAGRLDQLERAGLIRESSRVPELEYSFSHHLARDATYRAILHSRRQELHRRVGLAFESLYGDNLEREAHRLARHFELGQDLDRASRYYASAGDAAFRLYANEEAIEHYSRALEFEKRLEFDSERLCHLFNRRGRALELDSRFEEALANYDDMEALARDKQALPMLLEALLLQGQILCMPNSLYDCERGDALTAQALDMARLQGNRSAEAKVLWLMTNLWRIAGDLSRALDCGKASLAIARAENLVEQLAFTSNDLSHVYESLDQYETSMELRQESIGLWRELDNQPMLADALSSWSLVAYLIGQHAEALAAADEANEISRAIGNLWGQSFSRLAAGPIYWHLGDLKRAVESLDLGIRLGEEAGFPGSLLIGGTYLALIRCDMGQYGMALEVAQSATSAFEQYPSMQGLVLAALVIIHARLGQLDQARIHLEAADALGGSESLVEILLGEARIRLALSAGDYNLSETLAMERVDRLREIGIRAQMTSALMALGQARLGLGDLDGAADSLASALSDARQLQNRQLIWRILAAQSEVAEKQQDREGVERLRAEAWQEAQYIAGRAADAEMRQSFLSLPAVRALADMKSRES